MTKFKIGDVIDWFSEDSGRIIDTFIIKDINNVNYSLHSVKNNLYPYRYEEYSINYIENERYHKLNLDYKIQVEFNKDLKDLLK